MLALKVLVLPERRAVFILYNMNELIRFNEEKKYTSVYLTEQINFFRKEEGNRAVLRHSDLLKKIEVEFSEEIAQRKISVSAYKDAKSQSRKCYRLTYEESLQLLMSESKIVRKGVIGVIRELSEQNKTQLPQTFSEALRLAADLQEQNELQQGKIQGLEQALDKSEQFISIIRASKEYGVKETYFNWHKLKKYSLENGIEIKEAPCPRFITKKLYHVSVFKKVYPELNK